MISLKRMSHYIVIVRCTHGCPCSFWCWTPRGPRSSSSVSESVCSISFQRRRVGFFQRLRLALQQGRPSRRSGCGDAQQRPAYRPSPMGRCSNYRNASTRASRQSDVVITDVNLTGSASMTSLSRHPLQVHFVVRPRNGNGSSFVTRDPSHSWLMTHMTYDPRPMAITSFHPTHGGNRRGLAWWYWTTLSVLRAKKS